MLYVMSKNRSHLLAKTWPRWAAAMEPYKNDPRVRLNLILEDNQISAYAEALHKIGGKANIIPLKQNDRPQGYLYQQALEHAASQGYPYYIMSDDDWACDAGLFNLLAYLKKHPECPSVGAWNSYYDLLFPRRKHDEVVNCWSTVGENVFAMHTEIAMSVGGFDERLSIYDDSEIKMKMAWQLGLMPKQIIKAAKAKPFIGASILNDGGLGQIQYKQTLDEKCDVTVAVISERYGPEYVMTRALKNPVPGATRRPIVKWSKFYDDLGMRDRRIADRDGTSSE